MKETSKIYNIIIALLDKVNATYKVFDHRPLYTFEDAAEIQKESGWIGTETKSMVMKTDTGFMMYMTIQGKRLNFNAIKDTLGLRKVRLVGGDELKEHFNAEPGCAYPFGYDESVPLFVDPIVFEQEWTLFSPGMTTRTIQVKGFDLKKVFDLVENPVQYTDAFNE
jgi:Ala-tRNA(Pro) deacylase